MAVTTIRDKKTRKPRAYRAEVYVSGVRIADKLFDASVFTRSSAIAWHDDMKARASRGYTIHKTVGDVVRAYQAGPLQRKSRSTKDSKAYLLPYVLEAPIARVPLSDLTPNHVSCWLTWLRANAIKSPRRTSFREELVFFAKVLRWHKDHSNPGLIIPILRSHWEEEAQVKTKKPRRPDYYMQPVDIHRWLEVLSRRRDPAYWQLATLMIYTGLRVGEAAGLCWDAVDLRRAQPSIRVMRTITWDNGEAVDWQERAKTDGSIRYLRIPQVLVELLTSLQNRGTQPIKCSDGVMRMPVFLNKRGRELKYSSIKRSFNRAFKALGLEWSGTHIARHTLATLSLKATRDLPGVQAILGHTNAAQSQRYAKVIALEFGDGLERAAELIANHASDHA